MSAAWTETRAERLRREGKCWCGQPLQTREHCMKHAYAHRAWGDHHEGGTPR